MPEIESRSPARCINRESSAPLQRWEKEGRSSEVQHSLCSHAGNQGEICAIALPEMSHFHLCTGYVMEILITMETDVTRREGKVQRMPLHELSHPISSSRARLFQSFRFRNVTEQMRRSKSDNSVTPAQPQRRCSSSEQCYQYQQAASQPAITCCLISLALQMSPNARAVMAAAEEIGQNYQIM